MIVFKRNNFGVTAVHVTPPQQRERGTRQKTVGAFAEGSIARAKSKIREYVALQRLLYIYVFRPQI